jgi:ankyrin repeat protein
MIVLSNKPESVVIKDETLVRWYLDHGVSPNAATFGGYTAISNACRSASVEIVKLLVSRGGDVMDKDVVAQAVEQYSQGVSGRLEVVRYVLDLGAPINMRANIQMGPFWNSWMSVMGADTALHYAARGGKEDMVRLLLERGANKSLKTSPRASHIGEYKTALEIAEEKGFEVIADLLRNDERNPNELLGLGR